MRRSVTVTLFLLAAFANSPNLDAGQSGDQPLARHPDLKSGRQLFATCAGCHGPDAGGRNDGSVPPIAGQHWQQCVSCHGTQGQGNGPAGVPRLAGQQYGYLLRRIRDAAAGRGSALAGKHAALLNGMNAADAGGVADHLSRLDSGAALTHAD
jgi:cytochrome c553